MISKKIQDFLDSNKSLQTPFMVFDLDILKVKYQEFKDNFENAFVFYAVKCNPAVEVLKILDSLGSYFDVASIEEVNLCLSLGIHPEKLSWGSTIKKKSLIKEAYEKGVKYFAFDSIEELHKIAEVAPNSKVFCRILANNESALWSLSNKFGCTVDMAEKLMLEASKLNVIPYGISFHTGSQQLDVNAWEKCIEDSSLIFKNLQDNYNIKLQMINLGGGYPAYGYTSSYQKLSKYKEVIENALLRCFGKDHIPTIFTEPGRFLTADAGILKTEVVLVAYKSFHQKDIRWVYLDVGLFGGLAETMGEAIKYRILSDKEQEDKEVAKIAGPTCDGADILYINYLYHLPKTLQAQDYLYILSTGAYSTSYSSVNFNGFKPLKDYYI